MKPSFPCHSRGIVELIDRVVPLLLGVVAVLVPARRRGLALAGAIVAGLALASLAVAGGPDWRAAGLSRTYLVITAAIFAFGVLLTLLAAVLGRAGTATGAPAPRWATELRRAQQARLRAFRERPVTRGDLQLLAVHLLGAALAIAAPHLILLLAGVVITAGSGLLAARRAGIHQSPWGFAGATVILLLVSAAVIQIAGETPLGLADLHEGPFSPAFEPMAALGFALAAWPLLRLWPFHYEELGPFTPLAGAMLLGRVAAPLFPAGMEHWQPILYPLLILAACSALPIGDWARGIRALGVSGTIALGGVGLWAGGLFLAGEGLLALAVVTLPPRRRAQAGAALLLAALLQLVPLLGEALRTETFYTVVLALSVALLLVVSTPAAERRPVR